MKEKGEGKREGRKDGRNRDSEEERMEGRTEGRKEGLFRYRWLMLTLKYVWFDESISPLSLSICLQKQFYFVQVIIFNTVAVSCKTIDLCGNFA